MVAKLGRSDGSLRVQKRMRLASPIGISEGISSGEPQGRIGGLRSVSATAKRMGRRSRSSPHASLRVQTSNRVIPKANQRTRENDATHKKTIQRPQPGKKRKERGY